MPLFTLFNQIIDKLRKMTVITGAKGAKRDLFVSGVIKHLCCILLQSGKLLLTVRTIDHSGLTKPATPDTTSHNLKNNTVLGGTDIGDQRLLWIGGMVHIHIHLTLDHRRNILFCRNKFRNKSLFIIRYLIKGRHIDSRDLGYCM